MWVYVEFLEDDVCEIVQASNIKRFNKDDNKYNQKYSVKWKDGDYYKAQITYAKDPSKELTDVIEARRVRIVRKQLLKSGDESSAEEGKSPGTSMSREKNKKSLDLKKAAMENARKKNEVDILYKHKEKAQAEDTSSNTSIPHDMQKIINELKKENDILKKENSNLKSEKESLKTKTKHFEDLNVSLRKEVINLLKDFKNKLTHAMVQRPTDIKTEQIVDDEVK